MRPSRYWALSHSLGGLKQAFSEVADCTAFDNLGEATAMSEESTGSVHGRGFF